MLSSFIQEEMAREHVRALSVAAQRAAESARFAKAHRQRSRFSRAVGLRLVRVGVRLAGARAAVVLRGTARAPEPTLVRR